MSKKPWETNLAVVIFTTTLNRIVSLLKLIAIHISVKLSFKSSYNFATSYIVMLMKFKNFVLSFSISLSREL